jgi:hypothetical protein
MPGKKLDASTARQAAPGCADRRRSDAGAGKAAAEVSQRREAIRMLGDIEARAQESAERARLVLQRLS